MDFDASLLVVMGAFWVAYLIIRIFYIKPMTELLEGRRQEVVSAREVYDRALETSERQLEEQRMRLAEARLTARKSREETRRDAMAQRQALLGETKKVASQELARAGSELDAQVQEQRALLDQRARELADQVTQRLLGRAV